MSHVETVGRRAEALARGACRAAPAAPRRHLVVVGPSSGTAADRDRSGPARRVAILLGLVAVVALMGGVGVGQPARPAAGSPHVSSPAGGQGQAGEARPAPARHRIPLVPSRAGAGGG